MVRIHKTIYVPRFVGCVYTVETHLGTHDDIAQPIAVDCKIDAVNPHAETFGFGQYDAFTALCH